MGSAGGVSSAPSVADAAGDVDAPPSGSSSPPPSNEIAKTIAPRTSSASTTMNAIHPAPRRFEPRPSPLPRARRDRRSTARTVRPSTPRAARRPGPPRPAGGTRAAATPAWPPRGRAGRSARTPRYRPRTGLPRRTRPTCRPARSPDGPRPSRPGPRRRSRSARSRSARAAAARGRRGRRDGRLRRRRELRDRRDVLDRRRLEGRRRRDDGRLTVRGRGARCLGRRSARRGEGGRPGGRVRGHGCERRGRLGVVTTDRGPGTPPGAAAAVARVRSGTCSAPRGLPRRTRPVRPGGGRS